MVQKHYFYFGEKLQQSMKGSSLNQNNWDILRIDDEEGPFSIENSRNAYETNCKKEKSYIGAARIIVEELTKLNRIGEKVVSLGVGKGILEWNIKHLCPEIVVECTDYTTEAIEKLKKVFVAMDNGYTFDMINGDYASLGKNSTIVMYRVSTEFSREQWNDIFEKMYESGIENVIFVPTGLDTRKDMMNERVLHWRNVIMGRKDIFCGWLYSEDEFLNMFRGNKREAAYLVSNRISYENTALYFLVRNDKRND